MNEQRSPFEEIYSRPGHLIRRLQQIGVAIFKEEAAAHDLTPVQYATLLAIRLVPGIDNARLADVVALDRSNIGDVVIRLEKRGLVARRSTPQDRRLKLITVTPEGDALLDAVEAAVDRTQERILAPLRPAQRRQFTEMLKRVVNLNNEHSRAPLKLDAWRNDRLSRSAVRGHRAE